MLIKLVLKQGSEAWTWGDKNKQGKQVTKMRI